MAVTLRQYVDGPLKWAMYEKGLNVQWNRLNQLFSSENGTGIAANTGVLGNALIDDGTGTGYGRLAARPISGPFASAGGEATVSGYTVVPADPGGNYGPTPRRQVGQSVAASPAGYPPDGGFRNTR